MFKQKTAYEMRISDWSSDVCSSDLEPSSQSTSASVGRRKAMCWRPSGRRPALGGRRPDIPNHFSLDTRQSSSCRLRSEEHTSELQSLMRTSYAVFCLKKNKPTKRYKTNVKK